MPTPKKSTLQIAEFNRSFATQNKRSQKPIEVQYRDNHRKVFHKFLRDNQVNTSDIRMVLSLYDEEVHATGEDSNILQIYPHAMPEFFQALAYGRLDELAKSSSVQINRVNPIKHE